MICPSCGGKTKVTNTRYGGSPRRWASDQSQEAVGWYTPDWVVRKRLCPHCGWSDDTVELLVQDLEDGWQRQDS